jgi:hypothetical protein
MEFESIKLCLIQINSYYHKYNMMNFDMHIDFLAYFLDRKSIKSIKYDFNEIRYHFFLSK